MITVQDLSANFHQQGRVVWIGVRPARNEPMRVLEKVRAIAGKGLEDDRFSAVGTARQVTLIQEEHLTAVASLLSHERIDPVLTRRNLVVKGINLICLKGHTFQIGGAVLEFSGECHPCSRMEKTLGFGGYNAMRGHGGITARVIESGLITLHDAVIPQSVKNP